VTLALAHSDNKERAAGTYKGSFGFAPLLAYLDAAGLPGRAAGRNPLGRVAQVGVIAQRRRCAYATWSSFPVVGVGSMVSSAIEASLR
jgi:hypothetical protein